MGGRGGHPPVRSVAGIVAFAVLAANAILNADHRPQAVTAGGDPAHDLAPAGPATEAIQGRVRVAIPSVGIDASVVGVGLRDGALEVPSSGTVVGWYRNSARPGRPGLSILVGHYSWTGRPAVFYPLHRIAVGARITVRRHRLVEFTVTGVERYRKTRLPGHVYRGTGGGAQLRLITCAGRYEPEIGYRRNLVVTAEPVGARGG